MGLSAPLFNNCTTDNALAAASKWMAIKKVAIPTVFTSALAVQAEFKQTPDYSKAADLGITLSYICTAHVHEHPLCGKRQS